MIFSNHSMNYFIILLLCITSIHAVFHETITNFTVSEDAHIGTTIGRLQLNPDQSYRISGKSRPFTVNLTSGRVWVSETIDREDVINGTINFILISTSPPSILHTSIQILDVNDNSPIFPLLYQNVSIVEMSPIGSRIPLLPATDSDEGLNGTIASYKITPEGIFELIHIPSSNTNDGDLLYLELLVPLDRETKSLYSFNLTATDAGKPPRSSSTDIFLEVLDVNDNAPVFIKRELKTRWNGLSNRLITRVEASDADSGANGEINYTIPSPAESDYFEIVNGNELRAKIDHPPYCNFNSSISDCLVTVRATDGGSPPLSSSQTIHIGLSAENLHSPQIHIKLQASNVNFAVLNAAADKGAVVAVLSVTDEDGPLTEESELNIIDGNVGNFFILLPLKQFSVLHLNKKLDDSFPSVFELVFRASDGQKPPLYSERSLRIYRQTSSGAQTTEDGRSWNLKDIQLRSTETNNIRIAEDSPIGSFVTLIATNVTDCKFQMITKNVPFEVDIENGVVKTSRSLFTTDVWKYEVEITALPPPPAIRTLSIFLTINIDDMNDHAPKLINLPDRIDVSEDVLVGSQILAFQITDADEGKNAEWSASLISSEDSDYFRLSPLSSNSFNHTQLLDNMNNIRLILQKPLDFEEKKQLTVEIRVVDSGGLSTTALLHIHVMDVNDNYPQFPCLEVHTTVPSLSPIGTVVVEVLAEDADEVSANSLRYIISSASSTPFFSIDSKTGIVRTISTLQDSSYSFQVTVIDQGLLVSPQNVTIYIKTSKMNEAIPNLVVPDRIHISRKVSIGQVIGHLKSNATTTSSQSDIISVAPDGRIILKKRIIKDSGVVILGQYNDLIVSQCLKLIPDIDSAAPYFRDRSSVIELSDDVVVGQPLLKVSACTSKMCQYKTSCMMLDVEHDGLVRVKSHLNSVDHIKCEINVFDSFGRSDIMSLDVKRSERKLSDKLHLRRSYYYGLKENVTVGRVFGSLPSSSSFFYQTVSSTENDPIGLFPNGKLYVRRRFNSDSRTFYKTIIKASHRITNSSYTTIVIVQVQRINFHTPSCVSQKFVIQENLPINSFIGQLKAFDEDKGVNGVLTYELLNQKHHIFLGAATGQLKSLNPFDYEEIKNITFSVNISDSGFPSRNQTCYFTLEIKDVNDNSPIFEQSFYSMTIKPTDTFNFAVKAKDIDSKENGIIQYELANFQNLFHINKTSGELTASSTLKSSSLYNITVIARDSGEEPKSSKTFVIIRTTANHNQLPIFSSEEEDLFRINLRENYVGSVIGQLSVQSDLPIKWSTDDRRIAINSWGYLILIDSKNLHYDFNATFFASSSAGNSSKTIKFVVEHYDEKASDVIHVQENLVPFVLREFASSDVYIIFTEPSSDSFSVSEGRLILQRPLDREIIPTYRILIREENVYHLLTLIVEDVNDNEATCLERTVIVNIIPSDILLNCFDPDSSDADKNLTLKTSDGRVKMTGRTSFKIERELDDVVNVLHYKLQDEGQSSSITLIRGGHDPSIIFPSKHFSLLLSSATKLSESFGRITAESPIPVQYFVIGTSSIDIDKFSGELLVIKPEALRTGQNITVVAASARGIATTEVSIEVIEDSLYVANNAFIIKLPENQIPSKIVGRIDVGRDDIHLILDDPYLTIAGNSLVLRKTIPAEILPYNVSVEARKGRLSAVLQLILLTQPERRDGNSLRFWVMENSKYGTIVGQLATEEDEQNWELIEDIGLTIDSQNRLVTTRIFDREEFSLLPFKIRNSRTRELVEGQLIIEDENDNSPSLSSKTFSFLVSEDAAVGFVIGIIRFDDKDINNIFNFAIEKGNEFDQFKIYSDGRIYLKTVLDFERCSVYNLSVVLSDGLAPFVFNEVHFNVIVNVVDVNDNPPRLLSSKDFFVAENTKIGTSIGSFVAEDGDSADGGKIQYRILPRSLPLAEFYVNAVTGELKINKLIDYEKTVLIEFELEISDFGVPSLATIEKIAVHITDENDNGPTLSVENNIFEISELSGVGEVIHQFVTSDNDGTDENRLGFYFLDDTHNGLFDILPLSGQLIVASDVLDYEKQSEYNLSVNVRNIVNGPIDRQHIIVKLVDENDEPPRFIHGCPVHFELFENIIAPSVVGSTVADDDDAGENGLIAYSIVEGNMTMFAVNSASGIITSLISLDREEKAEHRLKIQVTDSGRPRLSSTCEVIIAVLDENDNLPEFQQPYYQMSILENLSNNSFLMLIQAVDKDFGNNGLISYRIQSPDRIPFSIDSNTGALYTNGIIDREIKDSYSMLVEATDHGRYRRQTQVILVNIFVLDVNDNSPTILNSQLDVFIPSSLKTGDVVHIVDAYDPDQNEKLIFSLSGPDSAIFVINEYGEIVTTKQLIASKSHYSITVTVTDSNDLNTSASFTYYISDPSQFPRFTSLPPRVSIKEQQASEIFLFHADSSFTSSSGRVTYSILSGNSDDGFDINSVSGMLSSKNTVDREKKTFYKLWIQATNSEVPPKSSWQTITVILEDVNDNHPIFEKVVYETKIEENFLSSEPLLTVSASDSDQDLNAKISYSIIGGNNGNLFSINENNGEIACNEELDRESQEIHELLICAKDHGKPTLNSTAVVRIRVSDVDDNSPRFTRIFYRNLGEDAPVGMDVLQIVATDVDATENLTFTLENFNDVFEINSKNGTIRLLQTLDRENISSYRLKIRVDDGSWTIQTNAMITIDDVNDNSPVFDQSEYFFLIKDSFKNPTDHHLVVGTVNATDSDFGENGNIRYHLDRDSSYITINASTGQLNLISYPPGLVEVLVVATDSGQPELSSNCSVKVVWQPIAAARPQKSILAFRSTTPDRAIGKITEIKMIVGVFPSSVIYVQDNGLIFLIRNLTNEESHRVQICLLALSEHNELIYQSLDILIADETIKPSFSEIKSVLTISESSPLGSELMALDASAGNPLLKQTLHYEVSKSSHPAFHVTPSGLVLVSSSSLIDYESHKIVNMTVEASAGGFSCEMLLEVHILDDNDNIPSFVLPILPQLVTSKSSKICLQAFDADSDSFGLLEFVTSSDDIALDAESGCFRTISSKEVFEADISALNGENSKTTCIIDIVNLSHVIGEGKDTEERNLPIRRDVCSAAPNGTLIFETTDNRFISMESTTDAFVRKNKQIIWSGSHYDHFVPSKIMKILEFSPFNRKIVERLLDVHLNPLIAPAPLFGRTDYLFEVKQAPYKNLLVHNFNWMLPSDCRATVTSENEIIPSFCLTTDGHLTVCRKIVSSMYTLTLKVYQGNATVSTAFVEIKFHKLMDEFASSYVVYLRENIVSLDVFQLTGQSSKIKINDTEVSQAFHISDEGMLVTSEGLDRERLGVYQIPIISTTTSRLIAEIVVIVDDEVDSTDLDTYDVQIIAVGKNEISTEVLPASTDSGRDFKCLAINQAEFTLNSSCFLQVPVDSISSSISLMATDGFMPYKYTVSWKRVSSSFERINASEHLIAINLVGPSEGISAMLSSLQNNYPDLTVLPFLSSSSSKENRTIVLALQDRHQNFLRYSDVMSVVGKFKEKANLNSILLRSFYPLTNLCEQEDWGCHSDYRCVPKVEFSEGEASFRSVSTIWLLPMGSVQTRCECSRANDCHKAEVKSLNVPSLDMSKFKTTPVPFRKDSCSNYDCGKSGRCIETSTKKTICHCDGGYTASNCDLDSVVTALSSSAHAMLKPTATYRHLVEVDLPNRRITSSTLSPKLNCEDGRQQIEMDFKTDTDQLFPLLTLDYGDIRAIVQLRHSQLVYMVTDGYRNPIEIALSPIVADSKFHSFILELSADRKTMRFQVDGAGKEARSMKPMPELLSPLLKKIIIGSDTKKMDSSRVSVKKLLINRKLQPLDQSAHELFVATLLDKSMDTKSLSDGNFKSGSSRTTNLSTSKSSLRPEILAILIGTGALATCLLLTFAVWRVWRHLTADNDPTVSSGGWKPAKEFRPFPKTVERMPFDSIHQITNSSMSSSLKMTTGSSGHFNTAMTLSVTSLPKSDDGYEVPTPLYSDTFDPQIISDGSRRDVSPKSSSAHYNNSYF